MSLEAIKQVTETEQSIQTRRAAAEAEARQIAADAEKAGQALIKQARSDAAEQGKELLRQAEARAAGVTAFCSKPMFLSDLRDALLTATGHAPSAAEPDGAKHGI